MPIFRDLALLFVHIPKNAGRSIELALLRGHDTPDGGRRSVLNRSARLLSKLTAPRLPATHLIGTLDYPLASQHLTYCEMDLLGLLPADSFRSFAVVRNPFDRTISSVNHFLDKRQYATLPQNPKEFENLLFSWLDNIPADHNQLAHRRSQFDYLTNNRGIQVVLETLRFEELEADFKALMMEIGHPEICLPWFGRSERKNNYRDYFTNPARKRVEQEFEVDFSEFKYRF